MEYTTRKLMEIPSIVETLYGYIPQQSSGVSPGNFTNVGRAVQSGGANRKQNL